MTKLSAQELHTSRKTSWHDDYKSSAWIFIGGLPFDLSEGDVIAVFSQCDEIKILLIYFFTAFEILMHPKF